MRTSKKKHQMELCEWVLRDHKSIPKRSVAHSQNKDNSSMPRLWGNIQVSSFRMLLFICKSTHRLICMWLNGISTSQANITVVRKYGSIQQISHLICSGPTKSTFPLHLWVFGTKRGPHKRYHSQTMGLCQHRRLLNLHHHFLTMVVCREINTKCDFIPREGKGGGGRGGVVLGLGLGLFHLHFVACHVFSNHRRSHFVLALPNV